MRIRIQHFSHCGSGSGSGSLCEFNSSFFRKLFQVFCFSLTLIPVTLRTFQNNNFFPWEKMPKRTFLQIKKIFHNLSAIYTVFLIFIHLDLDPKPCFQAAEGHSNTARREGCAKQGNWKISPHPPVKFQIQSIKQKTHHYMSHRLASYTWQERKLRKHLRNKKDMNQTISVVDPHWL